MSDSSTNDDDVDDLVDNAVPNGNVDKSPSEVLYEKCDHSFMTLVLLSRGLKDSSGKTVLDLDTDPWKSLTLKTNKTIKWKPKAKALKEHILWRCDSFGPLLGGEPRPKQWLVPKLLEWLDEHPITPPTDVAFLIAKVLSEKLLVEKTIENQKSENELLQRSWTGKYPYLRLIHALVDHDNIKAAFLHRHDIPVGRLHLENRNSVDKRQPTMWELLTTKWNDPLFCPTTELIEDLHSDFLF